MKLKLHQIASVLSCGAASDRTIDTLLTDSRSLADTATSLFFAVRTAVNDGHRYIPDLYRRGVRAFVVEQLPDNRDAMPGAEFLHVPDTTVALQALASYVRGMFSIPVVAITGSRGKTIVKELVYAALLRAGVKAVRSPRSWNSQIGVPLSVWQLEPDCEIAIFEAGIDAPGQMQALAGILRPTLGVLTYINDEHDSGFVSHAQKVEEKHILFRDVDNLVEGADNRELAGKVLVALGYSPELLDGIGEVSTRLDVHDGVNGCVTVYDEFTADCGSLAGALDFICRRKTASRRNTVVLGDLVHAADADPRSLYRQVAGLLSLAGIDRLIGIGPEISACRDVFDPLVAHDFVSSVDAFLAKYTVDDFDRELILIKGRETAGFDKVRRYLETPRHQTILEINLDAVVANYNAYRSKLKPSTGIVAMVKASGYGAGALEIGKTLQAHGASYLAVAVIEEGVALRRGGITMPIMILNPVTTNYQALFAYRLEPVVFSIDELRRLADEAARHGQRSYPVHVKLETGMRRLGFVPDELERLADALRVSPSLKVVSAFSHLATADCPGQDDYTLRQFDAFESMTARLASALGYGFKRHILNSAGIMRYPDRQYDMVRLGIGLYGISPLPPAHTGLVHTPVARLCSTVISLKHWPAGTTVGYGRRGQLERDSVIATVPIGYADGLDRHLGCGAVSFVVNGHRCPTVGNICMDLCMIDVTDAAASVGDRVEIFGPHAPVEELAGKLGTIPYEIIASVSPRIHRLYYRE